MFRLAKIRNINTPYQIYYPKAGWEYGKWMLKNNDWVIIKKDWTDGYYQIIPLVPYIIGELNKVTLKRKSYRNTHEIYKDYIEIIK